MITLTFRGKAPDLVTADNARRIFAKRLLRRYPDICAVWVREYGERNRRIHYHLLVYGRDHLPIKQLRTCWDYGAIHARRLARPAYLSKYLSKRSPARDEPGRWWGIINRREYDRLAQSQVIEVPRAVACEWRRLIRNIARKQIGKKIYTSRSFVDPRPYLLWKSDGRVDIPPPLRYNSNELESINHIEKGVKTIVPTELLAVTQEKITSFNWWELVSYTAGIIQALTSESLTHEEKKKKAVDLIKRYYLTLPVQPVPVYLLDLLIPSMIEQIYRWVVK